MFKKLFLSAVIAISCFAYSYAEENTCKISGTNDNVEVFSCFLDNDKAIVTLSNDSNDIKANVTVTVEVKYGSNNKRSFTGKVLSTPGSTKLEIPIDANVNGLKPTSVSVTSISGAKCL